MTDFSRSYSARWRVYKVDRSTWADSEITDGFLSADVSTSSGDMLQSGSLTFQSEPYAPFQEGYYRLVMYATQDGVTDRHDIATLYCVSTGGKIAKGSDLRNVTGVSVLHCANSRSVEDGTTVTRGSDGVRFAGRLLAEVLDAPVETIGSFVVSEHFTFAIGTSVLEAVTTVLQSGGWCIQISGDGTVTLRPMPTEPDLILGRDGSGILMPEESYELDTSAVPNRYMATDGIILGVATNDDPASTVSTVNRGFIVDAEPMVDSSPVLVGGETLSGYCRRRLHELSVVYNSRSYEREYADGVFPSSIIRREYDGEIVDMRVDSQTIKCGPGIIVSERSLVGVSVWQ